MTTHGLTDLDSLYLQVRDRTSQRLIAEAIATGSNSTGPLLRCSALVSLTRRSKSMRGINLSI
jgi:hypothetical protein